MTTRSVESLIDDINKRLDSLEESTLWLMKANLRFKKRQRVKLSGLALRRNFSLMKGVRKGTVVEVGDSFSITVLPDGYKKPHTYWHGFWEPVSK